MLCPAQWMPGHRFLDSARRNDYGHVADSAFVPADNAV